MHLVGCHVIRQKMVGQLDTYFNSKISVAPLCKVLQIQKNWSQILVQKYGFGHCLGNRCETDFAADANDSIVNTAYSVAANSKTFTI